MFLYLDRVLKAGGFWERVAFNSLRIIASQFNVLKYLLHPPRQLQWKPHLRLQ